MSIRRESLLRKIAESSDEELTEAIGRMLHSSSVEEMPDSVRDIYVSLPHSYSREKVNIMRARFVQKYLEKQHPRAVTHLEEPVLFGEWFGSARKAAHLAIQDIANAIGKEPSFIKKLEAGEILPWSLSVQDAAELITLFRVHIDVVTKMIKTSYAVNEARSVLNQDERSRKAAEPLEQNLSIKAAFDRYSARNSGKTKVSDEVKSWLKALRRELKLRKATHLLKKQ